jgi:hypothetical protein
LKCLEEAERVFDVDAHRGGQPTHVARDPGTHRTIDADALARTPSTR